MNLSQIRLELGVFHLMQDLDMARQKAITEGGIRLKWMDDFERRLAYLTGVANKVDREAQAGI